MKNLILILALIVSSVTLQAQSDSIELKIARLLELSGAEQQFLGVIDNMIGMQRGQEAYATIQSEWWDEFSQEVHQDGWNDILPALVEIYRENYSEEEIDHQISYLEDPMTQQIVAKQGNIMQQSMAVGGQWGQRMAEKINLRLQKKIGDN